MSLREGERKKDRLCKNVCVRVCVCVCVCARESESIRDDNTVKFEVNNAAKSLPRKSK